MLKVKLEFQCSDLQVPQRYDHTPGCLIFHFKVTTESSKYSFSAIVLQQTLINGGPMKDFYYREKL